MDKYDRVYDINNTWDRFTHNEMLTAISHLKTGKAVGNDCLSAESFKYADTSIWVFLCMLFNSILYHSYLPSKLMDTVIVPMTWEAKTILDLLHLPLSCLNYFDLEQIRRSSSLKKFEYVSYLML